jgi:hypothetical protein
MPRQRRPKAKSPTRIGHTIRGGGIEPAARDPLRAAPLREPYAANSGAPPQRMGTPGAVTKPRRRARRRR